MSLTKKQIGVLREVQSRIRLEPQTYNQSDWHCGTACCIAGHVATVATGATARKSRLDWVNTYKPVLTSTMRKKYGKDASWASIASEVLGLDSMCDMNLFSGDPEATWPEPFCGEWQRVLDADIPDEIKHAAYADIACRRIDYFIEEGE